MTGDSFTRESYQSTAMQRPLIDKEVGNESILLLTISQKYPKIIKMQIRLKIMTRIVSIGILIIIGQDLLYKKKQKTQKQVWRIQEKKIP